MGRGRMRARPTRGGRAEKSAKKPDRDNIVSRVIQERRTSRVLRKGFGGSSLRRPVRTRAKVMPVTRDMDVSEKINLCIQIRGLLFYKDETGGWDGG